MKPAKKIALRASLVSLAALVVGGCTVGPNYREPEIRVPDAYGIAPATQPLATQPATTRPITAAWWESFGDEQLDRLIEQAAQSNLDLRIAEARVREARAQHGVVRADRYPSVDAGGGYTRTRASRNVGGGAPMGPGGDPGFSPVQSPGEMDLWQAGFDASWEIDLFGGVRRSIQAADAELDAALAERNDVLLTLLGEVARNYVELRGFQRQRLITENNVRAQLETFELTRAKFDAGLTSDLDVARAEAQVASTRAQIPSLETAEQQAIHRLSVLLGREPSALRAELSPPQPIPAPPPEIPPGLPSDLLRRRPDVRRAERNLAAATARVGVAISDLFPRFSLMGSLGQQAQRFKDLGDSGSTFWSIGPGFSWPIFNAGRIRNNVRVAEAQTEQALADYERTVLNSLAEVEDALIAYRNEYVRRQSLASAVDANQRAVTRAQQLYDRGLSTFLDVLDAQRALYLSQDELARSDTAVSANAVALFKALGGGWE